MPGMVLMPWELPIKIDEGGGFVSDSFGAMLESPISTLEPYLGPTWETHESVVVDTGVVERTYSPKRAPTRSYVEEFPYGTFGGVITTPEPIPQPDVVIEFVGTGKYVVAVDDPEGNSYSGMPATGVDGGSWLADIFDFANDAINPFAWFGADPVRTVTGGVGGLPGILGAGSMIGVVVLMMMMDRR